MVLVTLTTMSKVLEGMVLENYKGKLVEDQCTKRQAVMRNQEIKTIYSFQDLDLSILQELLQDCNREDCPYMVSYEKTGFLFAWNGKNYILGEKLRHLNSQLVREETRPYTTAIN